VNLGSRHGVRLSGLAERVSQLTWVGRLDETDLGRYVSRKLSGDGLCLNDPVRHPMTTFAGNIIAYGKHSLRRWRRSNSLLN
jgi:hypothetical protein